MKALFPEGGGWHWGNYQPKQCIAFREIPQNYHKFASSLIPLKKIGHLMTPVPHNSFLGYLLPHAKSTELVEPLATFITGLEVEAEADAWLDA